jgi:cytochrome c oxidase subunit III
MFQVQEAVMPVDPTEPEIKNKALRTLLWFGIVSITMLFAGLTSAYIVRQGEGKWVEFSLPVLFAVSSVFILLSSVTMQWGLNSIKKNRIKNLRIALLLTLLLGTGFVFSQYYAWSELYHNGIVFTGTIGDIKTDYKYIPSNNETAADARSTGNVAASFLYVITGLHVAHLLAGLITLIIVFSRALIGKYSANNYNGVRLCAIYWHFLDGLWLYLFLFLLYIR